MLMIDEATLRSDFEQFDTDKNGYIDQNEFTALLDFLGIEFTSQQTAVAFLAIDVNGNARIEFGEFRAWWLKYQED